VPAALLHIRPVKPCLLRV